jgi:protein TonB
MDPNKILAANILDIIFEGKNKAYGAYELRNTYNNRLKTSLALTFVLISIILSVFLLSKNEHTENIIPTYIFEPTAITPEIEKKAKAKKEVIKQINVKTIQSTKPVIVDDILVTKPPPDNALIMSGTINIKTSDGTNESSLLPPVEKVSSPVELAIIKANIEDETPVNHVEIQAMFKGDWTAFVKKQIEKNIDDLVEAGESGTCIVRFVVSKTGKVSDVEAITMKGSKLSEVAVNAIRKGPNWIPAQQNGREVNAYRHQPVTFKIDE